MSECRQQMLQQVERRHLLLLLLLEPTFSKNMTKTINFNHADRPTMPVCLSKKTGISELSVAVILVASLFQLISNEILTKSSCSAQLVYANYEPKLFLPPRMVASEIPELRSFVSNYFMLILEMLVKV